MIRKSWPSWEGSPAPGLLSVIPRSSWRAGWIAILRRWDGGGRASNGLLAFLTVVHFDTADARAYGDIVRAVGYSRRKLLDRMIAAQARVRGATLVTANPADFRDVPGLELLAW